MSEVGKFRTNLFCVIIEKWCRFSFSYYIKDSENEFRYKVVHNKSTKMILIIAKVATGKCSEQKSYFHTLKVTKSLNE